MVRDAAVLRERFLLGENFVRLGIELWLGTSEGVVVEDGWTQAFQKLSAFGQR